MLLLHMPYTIINAATAKLPLVAGAATVGTVVDSFIANFFSFFFFFLMHHLQAINLIQDYCV